MEQEGAEFQNILSKSLGIKMYYVTKLFISFL